MTTVRPLPPLRRTLVVGAASAFPVGASAAPAFVAEDTATVAMLHAAPGVLVDTAARSRRRGYDLYE